MNYSIIVNQTFVRVAKRLGKKYPSFKADLLALQDELIANPQIGVDLGRGIRKVRMAIGSKGKGKGKSHGARVITVIIVLTVEEAEINLLYIYDKAECDSISSSEIEQLLKVNEIEL